MSAMASTKHQFEWPPAKESVIFIALISDKGSLLAPVSGFQVSYGSQRCIRVRLSDLRPVCKFSSFQLLRKLRINLTKRVWKKNPV